MPFKLTSSVPFRMNKDIKNATAFSPLVKPEPVNGSCGWLIKCYWKSTHKP